MENLIKKILRNSNYSLSDEDINRLSNLHYENIKSGNYDFTKFNKKVLTQRGQTGKKYRTVYSFDKGTTENILCEYFKIKLDNAFDIRYADRKKIMKILFNTLPVIKDLNDFVIVRFDFKSFFDSVSTNLIFDEYIQMSAMKRSDKDYFQEFCNVFSYCYAGLQTSNAMTEIVSSNFDKVFRAKLNEYGIVFFERYVDDVLVILTSYVSEADFLKLLEDSIFSVFKKCKVKINPRKFNYISRRTLPQTIMFDFLGYNFTINKSNRNTPEFEFGITPSKIKKYRSKIRQTLIEYKKDGNLELLRHRMKVFSCRVVYSIVLHDDYCTWITKGLTDNYGELRFHLKNLDAMTVSFLKNAYYNEMRSLGVPIPYFMAKGPRIHDESIYNLYSNLKRNRSLVFDERVGIKIIDLAAEVRKVSPHYYCGEKTYGQIAKAYFDVLNI
ncbi:MAG: reverse transcriptase domain-containing protein [Oscillospiraceae bacterium]